MPMPEAGGDGNKHGKCREAAATTRGRWVQPSLIGMLNGQGPGVVRVVLQSSRVIVVTRSKHQEIKP